MRKSPFPLISASKTTIRKNDEVRASLMRHGGDDGSAPRNVRHFLYPEFVRVKPRGQVAAQLIDAGFSVDLSQGDDGVIAEENREVASVDFDSLTGSLEQMSREIGWIYDGWECAVVHEDI